ncbi:hypothetical protein AB0K00_21610 [Dactylosporangium sp. NPDC049525]|uniref:hypothetical protein n=1 Tax=Dactylosporangium sp. NPDC049525 TaxID=3154730 RepID=UPI0034387464
MTTPGVGLPLGSFDALAVPLDDLVDRLIRNVADAWPDVLDDLQAGRRDERRLRLLVYADRPEQGERFRSVLVQSGLRGAGPSVTVVSDLDDGEPLETPDAILHLLHDRFDTADADAFGAAVRRLVGEERFRAAMIVDSALQGDALGSIEQWTAYQTAGDLTMRMAAVSVSWAALARDSHTAEWALPLITQLALAVPADLLPAGLEPAAQQAGLSEIVDRLWPLLGESTGRAVVSVSQPERIWIESGMPAILHWLTEEIVSVQGKTMLRTLLRRLDLAMLRPGDWRQRRLKELTRRLLRAPALLQLRVKALDSLAAVTPGPAVERRFGFTPLLLDPTRRGELRRLATARTTADCLGTDTLGALVSRWRPVPGLLPDVTASARIGEVRGFLNRLDDPDFIAAVHELEELG